jgi:hypothetical protein
MNLSLILHPLDYSAGAKPALARALARKAVMTSSRASTLDSNLYSIVPSSASQANRIGGLASW